MSQSLDQNNLSNETSPYLLQHADNPVYWQPWSPATLNQAKTLDRPILLSVGYAACHWCHVMAHESFEDQETADLMNALFVNIKIDREERPDLDTIYQSALALLGGHGGWPLTMFLTPDGHPFWGGTYFPKISRHGQPAFADVLNSISRLYREDRAKIMANVDALKDGIGQINTPKVPTELSANSLQQTATQLLPNVDMVNGGFHGAPKFPYTSFFDLLWIVYLNTGETKFADAVDKTLTGLCQGGIYDHLSGGFSRYTVDDKWLVPHFEKMLYDNAAITGLMTTVWRQTKSPLLTARIEETIDWVHAEIMSLEGGFTASLDADSEGEEGKFYVWSQSQIESLLGQDSDAFSKTYDVSPDGNWEGKTILNRLNTPEWQGDDNETYFTSLKKRLKAARNDRIRPAWDDKVLTDWNGLMITSMTEASLAFDREDWLKTAENAFNFIVKSAGSEGPTLTHSYRNGRAHIAGLADDYAAMAASALVLHEATGKTTYLGLAEAWCETLLRDFLDEENGGFFLTNKSATDVIVRTRNAVDAATPSANGSLTMTFAKLYFLTGNESYRQTAEHLVRTFASSASDNPVSHATLLTAADFAQNARQITVLGSRTDPATTALLRIIFEAAIPHRLVAVIDDPAALPKTHPAAGKTQLEQKPTVYLCRGQTCSIPMTDPAELKAALQLPSNL